MRVLFVNLNNKLSQSEDFLVRLSEMQAINNLACMANIASQEHHTVKIVDFDIENVDNSQLVQTASEYKPHAIVIHLEDEFVHENLKTVSTLKAGYAGSKIIIHNNYLYHLSLSDLTQFDLDAVDVILREEPNDLLPKLLDCLFDNYPMKKISNVKYKGEDKRWRTTDSVFFQHLDAISTPYRKGLKNDLYKNVTNDAPLAIIKAGRGSTSACIYESVAKIEGNKFRVRSPESIAREIEYVRSEFGIKDFYLEIEAFNHDNDWAYDVAQEIRNTISDKISIITRLNLKDLNQEVVEQLHFAGCHLVITNMGSAAEETVRRSKIGAKSDFYKNSLNILHHHGIKTYGIYRIGFPWEMKKHIEETTKMMSDFAHTYLDFKILTPTIYSEAYEMLKEENLLGEKINDSTYSISGTKYLKKEEVEKLYKGFLSKYKLLKLIKKEKVNENPYALSENDKKIKNKKRVQS